MIKSLEDLAKRSMSKSTYHLISICNRITSCNFGLAILIGKIFKGVNSSFANIEYFIPEYFFLLKHRQKGILLFLLALLHLDCVTPLVRWLIFHSVRGIDELNMKAVTFSVCILNDLNLDLVSDSWGSGCVIFLTLNLLWTEWWLILARKGFSFFY